MPAAVPEELFDLGRAIGLVDGGNIDGGWFEEPEKRLGGIITNAEQREALLELLASLLGTADGEPPHSDGVKWIPLGQGANDELAATVYLVADTDDGGAALSLGAGVTVSPSEEVTAAVRVRVPVVAIDDGDSDNAGSVEAPSEPSIDLAVDVEVASGLGTDLVDLAGLSLSATIRLDDLEDSTVGVVLRGLRLPGQAAPEDVALDDLADRLGPTAVRIGVAAVQAQSNRPEELTRLLALLGLDDTPEIPPIRVDDLVEDGPAALRRWLLQLLNDSAAVTAWLDELRRFLGVTDGLHGAGTVADPYAICLSDPGGSGAWTGCLTVAVDADPATGAVTLVPGARATFSPGDGTPSGHAEATLELCRLVLGPTPTVTALPSLSAALVLGEPDDDAPLVDVSTDSAPVSVDVTVDWFRFGLGLAGGTLTPLASAHDVTVGTDHYDVVDLTSADALADVGEAALDGALDQLVDALDVTASDEGRALAALAGLTRPAGAPSDWPELVGAAELFSDPLGAVTCYHARVLARSGDPRPWSWLAAELGVLLRAAGADPPAVNGSGTPDDPWRLALFDNTAATEAPRGAVEALVWADPPEPADDPDGDGGARLHVAVRTRPALPPFDGATVTLGYRAELLTVDLPPAATCPAPISLRVNGVHTVELDVGTDLALTLDGLELRAHSVHVAARWAGGDELELSWSVEEPAVVVDDAARTLPPLQLDWRARAPALDLEAVPWEAVELLLGGWASGDSNDWLPRLAALLGWLPSLGDLELRLDQLPDLVLELPAQAWPRLDLATLVDGDVAGALRAWLTELTSRTGGDFPDLTWPLVAWLDRLLDAGAAGDADEDDEEGPGGLARLRPRVTGTGTYADPWAVPLTEHAEALFWLDPEGPALGSLTALTDHLRADDLTAAAAGGAALSTDRLAALLHRAAAVTPALRDAVDGVDLSAALAALRAAVAGGDGLVPASVQAPSGWPTDTLDATGHLAAPASFDPGAHLPGDAPDATRHLYVAPAVPGLADWPGQTAANTLDLTAPKRSPESFDVSAIDGPGPWFVRLPAARADCAVAQPEQAPGPTQGAPVGALDGAVGRLRRAVAQAADKAGGDLAVIAHSTAGHVARRVAGPGVSHVVTVATPQQSVDLSFLQAQDPWRALRLVQRFVRDLGSAPPDGAEPLVEVLAAAGVVLDGAATADEGRRRRRLPPADLDPPDLPPLPSGVAGHAVVARVRSQDLDAALAAVVDAVVDAATGQLPRGGRITHVGLGARLHALPARPDERGVTVDGSVRLDAHRIELAAAADDDPVRPTPRVSAHLWLGRGDGGWLVPGPGAPARALPEIPRLRAAELELTVDLAPLAANTRVVLHDAAVFDDVRSRWVVDEDAVRGHDDERAGLVPEARVLLAEVVAQLDPPPSSGPLGALVDLTEVLSLVTVDDGGLTLPPEPVERFLVDPLGELRARLGAPAAERTAVRDALRDLVAVAGAGGAPSPSPDADRVVVPLGDGLRLVLVLAGVETGPVTGVEVALEAEDVTLAGAVAVTGRLRVDHTGRVAADLTAAGGAPAGPLGRPTVSLTGDSATGATTLDVALADARVAAVPTDGGPPRLRLVPFDADAAGAWLRRQVPVQVLAHSTAWLVERGTGDAGELLALLSGAVEAASGATATDSATVDAVRADARAVVDGEGQVRRAAARVLTALAAEPASWLLAPEVLGRKQAAGGLVLAPGRVRALLDVARDVLDLPGAPGGPVPLPWDVALDVTEPASGVVAVAVTWDPPGLADDVEGEATLTLAVGAGFEVRPSTSARLRTDLPADEAHAEVRLDADEAGEVGLVVALATDAGDATVRLLPKVSGLDGLASLLGGSAAEALLPLVLDALAATDPDGLGDAVKALGDALGLRSGGGFDAAELAALAPNPDTDLGDRPTDDAALVEAAESLAGYVVPARMVRTDGNGSGTALTVTAVDEPADGDGTAVVSATVHLGGDQPRLCVDATGLRPVPDMLEVALRACVSPAGLQGLRARVEVVDDTLDVGPVALLPVATVLLGEEAGAAGDRVEAGLWSAPPPDDGDRRQAVLARVTVPDGQVTAVCATQTGTNEPEYDSTVADCATALVRTWLAPLLAELLLDTHAVTEELLNRSVDGDTVGGMLAKAKIVSPNDDGDGFDLEPGVFDPATLPQRLLELVTAALDRGVTVPGLEPLALSFQSQDADGGTRYGVSVGLDEPLELFDGEDVRLSLVSDADWVDDSPAGEPPASGVAVYPFKTVDGDDLTVDFEPALTVGGLGLRAEHPGDETPLLDVGVALEAVEASGFYRRVFTSDGDVDARFRLLLRGLAVPLGQADGDNPVAAKILSQTGEGASGDTQELAPVVSPDLRFTFAPDQGFELRLAGGSLPMWLPVQRSFGPLYVDQVGVDLRGTDAQGDPENAVLLVDGGVELEGLSLGLDDLGVLIPIDAPLETSRWKLTLAGLAVGYQGSGVSVAGGFRRFDNQYAGMVQVDAGEYGLTAVGAYGEFPVPGSSGETFASLFVVGAVEAPLGGPPAFFLTGIGAGFGLNRRLSVPDEVTDVGDFTLVQALDDARGFAEEPLDALQGLLDDFPVERGTFWLAAGIRATHFALVESVAVLAVEIGDHLEVNLLGLARTVLPDEETPLASVEMALRARFSTRNMVLSVEAQLTDNSWVLTPDCRLTGGFAFVVWFDTEEFVFTLGGYHPRFAVPDKFPAVPRLGFHWDVSNAIVVKGEAYFALTSSVVMAGGKLEAGYTTSKAWATFTVGADALLSWDPFFYMVGVHVQVSAGVRIEVCVFGACAGVTLSLSIGAEAEIKGPELSGRATLDLDVMKLTVRFGADEPSRPPPLGWGAFHRKYLQQGDPDDVTMSLSFVDGLSTADPATSDADSDSADGSAARPYEVTPEFAFVTATQTASTAVVLAGGETSQRFDHTTSGVGATVDLQPMKRVDVFTTHRVTLDGSEASVGALEAEPVVRPMPAATWVATEQGEEEPGNERIHALTGLRVRAVPDLQGTGDNEVEIDQTEVGDAHRLPFNDEIADRDRWHDVADAAAAWAARQPLETADRLAAVADLLEPSSAFAERVGTADLVAPPRLRSLAEGMVDELHPPVELRVIPRRPVEEHIPAGAAEPALLGLLSNPPPAAATAAPRLGLPDEFHDPRTAGEVPTVAMPTVAAVEAALGVPARLDRVARVDGDDAGPTPAGAGAGEQAGTAVAGGRTLVAGSGMTATAAASLRQLAAAGREGGARLLAGETAVWDVHGAGGAWQVDGDQPVRTIALDRAGRPLTDHAGTAYQVDLPAQAGLVITLAAGRVAGDAAAADRDRDGGQDGLPGWQETTRLVRGGSRTLVGPGCVVVADGLAPHRRRRRSVGTTRAGGVLPHAAAVSTHLPADVTAVAVALEVTDPTVEPTDQLRLGLEGATHSVAAPDVVAVENRVVAVYDVAPHADAGGVAVSAATGPGVRLVGVLGAALSADRLVEQLADEDLSALTGRLAGGARGASTVGWRRPDPTSEGAHGG